MIDHGMGNLRSVAKALEAAGADVRVSSTPSELATADAMCVPGQGIFGRCMSNLASASLDEVVVEWIGEEKPFLGICLGMQILFGFSAEGGGHAGLGLFEGGVERLTGPVAVPHIGWNTVSGEHFYFDHSYAVFPEDASLVSGWCEHGRRFAAMIETRSVLGVQFHPEKSGRAGIDLLRTWVSKPQP